jgi:hypothetical protein
MTFACNWKWGLEIMLYDIYNPYSNQTVTKEYVSVIETALNNAGFETRYVQALNRKTAMDSNGVVVIIPLDVLMAKYAGYRSVILWIQGVSPEESYMRNHSRLRYHVLSWIERSGTKRANVAVLVSDAMREHFEKKYSLTLSCRYIMPCFNNEIEERFFRTKGKYEGNTFIYAGSMAPWQCFEETVIFYKAIEEQIEDAELRVLVKEQNEAKRILEKYQVRNYSIGFVPQEQIGNEMSKAKFGFCLRQDNVVNHVATPTKLSTYIAHGVMPIYSKSLKDFAHQAERCPFCFVVDLHDVHSADQIIDACKRKTVADDVFGAYTQTFGTYYSKEYHVRQLSNVLRACLPRNLVKIGNENK